MARTANRFNAIRKEPVKVDGNYKVALYARLSVDIEEEKAESIENQIDMMKQYVEEHPQFSNYSIYSDKGYSGMTYDRPDFIRMMDDIKDGKINCVIVKDLSRFGRDYLETGNYIEIIFPFMGVRLISINDEFDTDKEMNSNKALAVSITNLINDTYARNVSKNVSISRKLDMEKGKFTGSNAPYGYKVNTEDSLRRYVIDPKPAVVVKQIFDLILKGNNLRQIARYLEEQHYNIPGAYLKTGEFFSEEKKKWHIGTISNILNNRAYLGHMVQGKRRKSLYGNENQHNTDEDEWIVVENTHEPIISEEAFNRVRELLDSKLEESTFIENKSVDSKPDKYKDLLYCGECDNKLHLLSRVEKDERFYYYRCTNDKDSACGVYIREVDLDQLVFQKIEEKISEVFSDDNESWERLEKQMLDDLGCIDKEITDTSTKISKEKSRGSNLYEKYAVGSIERECYINQSQSVKDYIDELELRLKRLEEKRMAKVKEIDESISWIRAMLSVNGELPKRTELLAMISKIELFPKKKIEIDWKLNADLIQILADCLNDNDKEMR